MNISKKMKSKNIPTLSAKTIKDAALAVALQTMTLAKLSGKTPKQALGELGINIPEDISNDWETINFQKLYEGEKNDR